MNKAISNNMQVLPKEGKNGLLVRDWFEKMECVVIVSKEDEQKKGVRWRGQWC